MNRLKNYEIPKKSLDNSVPHLLETYKLNLEAANRSLKYISWSLDNLTSFFNFLDSNNILKPIADLGTRELDSYIQHLRNRNRWQKGKSHSNKDYGKLSASSIAGHVRAIKVFWSWLVREEYIEKNPIARFPSYKVPQYVIRVLNSLQINKLLSAIDKSTPIGYRCYCTFLLLLDTGMRISELVSIKVEDIDMGQSLVRIFGKGQKERFVPFSRSTRKALIRYLANYRSRFDQYDSIYLFPANGGHISISSIQQYMRRLSLKVGLDGIKLSPHILRHTCATFMITKGANVYVVKDILGHCSLQTTLKYTHLQLEDIKSQHNRYSPVEGLLNRV